MSKVKDVFWEALPWAAIDFAKTGLNGDYPDWEDQLIDLNWLFLTLDKKNLYVVYWLKLNKKWICYRMKLYFSGCLLHPIFVLISERFLSFDLYETEFIKYSLLLLGFTSVKFVASIWV